MNRRETDGPEIAARMRVLRDATGWAVPSQTGGTKYRVDAAAASCSCPDFDLRRSACKHVYAVRFVIQREQGESAPEPDAADDFPPEPTPKRPTYRQDWPAYNRAQAAEKHRFQVLLADLCRGIDEPPVARTGRPRIPRADAVFAAAFKVYSTVSSRRFNGDLQDAHARGHLSRPVHHNKVNAFLEDADLTPVLLRLIRRSSLPLAGVEVDFAADSTAFTSCKFVRWFDVKHGKNREWHVWVKLQMMCGVKTNIVTSAAIVPDGPDCGHLPQLVRETAENFVIGEVSADKGYSTVAANECVEAAGGTPFIAFKKDATGRSGGLWGKMFHYFQFRRDEFLAHYHKRSNAEATFSMMKRKFGDSLRSKTDAAMANEVLCKVLCHNLCVVIHEQEALGIAADFWPTDDADELPTILTFPAGRRTVETKPGRLN